MREQSRPFGDLTSREIREGARLRWLAVIPTGCTERQGPHLPVDCETWFAETLMLAAAEKAAQDHAVQALVLPAMPFGPPPEPRHVGSGCIDLPLVLHHVLTQAMLSSLMAQGFERMILWQGCGGHHLREVVDHFNRMHQGKTCASDAPKQKSEQHGKKDGPCARTRKEMVYVSRCASASS
jgi:creatinine amidohydrolase